MRRILAVVIAFVAASAVGAFAAEQTPQNAHSFSFIDIDGAPLPLSQFDGRPMLIVNTASRCGFTDQYDGLQAVWDRYRDRGLVVLGVPSDDFNQELATAAAVKEFCEVNFAIDFPMTEIENVKGLDAHPFFAWAAEQTSAPRWNFFKYLVSSEGELIAMWPSRTKPQSADVVSAIEAALPR